MKSEQLPSYKTERATVWELEMKTGERFDIIHNLMTGEWIIDEVFFNTERDDWDGKEIHRGSSKAVFDLMAKCGVKFLAS
jgi:hypothetical protein